MGGDKTIKNRLFWMQQHANHQMEGEMAAKNVKNGDNGLKQLNNGKMWQIRMFKMHFIAKCHKCDKLIKKGMDTYFVGGKPHCSSKCAQTTQNHMETNVEWGLYM